MVLFTTMNRITVNYADLHPFEQGDMNDFSAKRPERTHYPICIKFLPASNFHKSNPLAHCFFSSPFFDQWGKKLVAIRTQEPFQNC